MKMIDQFVKLIEKNPLSGYLSSAIFGTTSVATPLVLQSADHFLQLLLTIIGIFGGVCAALAAMFTFKIQMHKYHSLTQIVVVKERCKFADDPESKCGKAAVKLNGTDTPSD